MRTGQPAPYFIASWLETQFSPEKALKPTLEGTAARRPPNSIIGEGNSDVMRKRFLYGSGIVLLLILATLVVWQGSFSFRPFAPSGIEQTYLFWAVSTLIFILTVMLGFILIRTGVRLYIERQANRPGCLGLLADGLALGLVRTRPLQCIQGCDRRPHTSVGG